MLHVPRFVSLPELIFCKKSKVLIDMSDLIIELPQNAAISFPLFHSCFPFFPRLFPEGAVLYKPQPPEKANSLCYISCTNTGDITSRVNNNEKATIGLRKLLLRKNLSIRKGNY